jgi:thioredoxin-like negative regulator of GroEL
VTATSDGGNPAARQPAPPPGLPKNPARAKRLKALFEAFDEAQEYYDTDRLAAVAKALRSEFPRNPRGFIAEALAVRWSETAAAAIPKLRRIAAEAPVTRRINRLLADALLEAGRPVEAREALALVTAEPDAAGKTMAVDFPLARIALHLDDHDAAERHLAALEGEEKDSERALRLALRIRRERGDVAGLMAAYRELERRGELGPDDAYRRDVEAFVADGRVMPLEASRAYVDAHPDSEFILIRHSQLLAFNGRDTERLAFVEDAIRRLPDLVNLKFERIDIDVGGGSFERVIEQIDAIRLTDPAAHERARFLEASALHALHRSEEALAILSSPSDEIWTAYEVNARCDILLELRDARRALPEAIRLYRACPNVKSTVALVTALRLAGRHRAAAAVADRLRRFPRSEHVLAARAGLALDNADIAAADPLVAELMTGFKSLGILERMADLLWQKGASRTGYLMMLAFNMNRPIRWPLDPDAGRVGEDAVSAVGALRARASTDSPAERRAALAELARLLPRHSFLKLYGVPGRELDAVLAEFTRLEAGSEVEAALAVIEPRLEELLGSTARERAASILALRVATLRLAAGRGADAVAATKYAALVDRGPLRVARVRDAIRASAPRVRVGGASRLAILLVSWRGNLAEAEATAADIASNTGRNVFVLLGGGIRAAAEIEATAYGHRLTVPTGDGYEALPAKVATGFQVLFACTDCTGVLKIDDDLVPTDFAAFDALCARLAATDADYVGSRSRSWPGVSFHFARRAGSYAGRRLAAHRHVPYALGGSGYFLSRRALGVVFDRSLVEFPPGAADGIYEDVYIAELLERGGIPLTHLDIAAEGHFAIDAFDALTVAKDVGRLLS